MWPFLARRFVYDKAGPNRWSVVREVSSMKLQREEDISSAKARCRQKIDGWQIRRFPYLYWSSLLTMQGNMAVSAAYVSGKIHHY